MRDRSKCHTLAALMFHVEQCRQKSHAIGRYDFETRHAEVCAKKEFSEEIRKTVQAQCRILVLNLPLNGTQPPRKAA